MLLALLLTAQAAGATIPVGEEAVTEAALTRGASCATVVVTSPQVSPGRPGFSVTQILDLDLRAYVRPLPAGPHLLELKLYTPHGHLYQVLPVAFEGSSSDASPADVAPAQWQAAYRNPLPVQRAPFVRVGGAVRQRVRATLPVAGTSIVTASLFGRWRVEVHIDGAPRSCGTPATFRLGP